MTDEEQTYEYSEFSGQFSDDGVVVELRIYRPAGTNHDWVLEVIDEEGFSTTWEDPFPTDREAFEEFIATVQRDGIQAFTDEPPQTVH
ncbi:hypothetical protein AB4Z34_27765 [Ensifer sp. 2YAB10]|uniref:hypothetical protein n=1 Tax=Ensifer TaxID=106591 RepID=UPI000DE218C9|nr:MULTISPECIES: hypothetical protein [Ensifer]MBK5567855.1 hypothetical protein [Ensifer sp. SSB1]MBZ7921559.1 hypothetical protein [Ensifer adhaerens]UAX93983.1 hypothetical protein LAC78_07170 [Ensifer adhaerens]UAY01618.1 hypothetical protein LAC80_07175 [Ensifer adhaerens]UAY09001.1 hypothetical protein LAC81_07175 [Ensifer adhaerens]